MPTTVQLGRALGAGNNIPGSKKGHFPSNNDAAIIGQEVCQSGREAGRPSPDAGKLEMLAFNNENVYYDKEYIIIMNLVYAGTREYNSLGEGQVICR